MTVEVTVAVGVAAEVAKKFVVAIVLAHSTCRGVSGVWSPSCQDLWVLLAMPWCYGLSSIRVYGMQGSGARPGWKKFFASEAFEKD